MLQPEHRPRVFDLVSQYVADGLLSWGADGIYAFDPTGRAPWYVLEVLKVWNDLLWWPTELLGELLDLMEAKSFMSDLAGDQRWAYEQFKELQRRLSEHINARDQTNATYVLSDTSARKQSYRLAGGWTYPGPEDGVQLVKRRVR